ncbi:MAG: ABC transporter ATP-binding protein [Spirochaetaceae bacterium]|nr:ABC transporter ATP-binding protein [Spirochaetaceae bacterium]
MSKIKHKLKQIFYTTFNIGRAIKFVWEGSHFWMIFNLIIQFLQGVFPVLLLLLLKYMIDGVTQAANGQGNYPFILMIIIFTGVVTFLSQTFSSLGKWGNREQGRLVSDYMTGILLDKASKVDYQFFENAQSLDSLHRAQEQATHRPGQIVNSLSSIVQNLVSLGGVLWIIFRFHPLIIVVLLFASLPGLINRMFFSTREYLNERQCTEKERTSFYYQYMVLERNYAKEVRLFHLAGTVINRFNLIRKDLRKIRHDLDVRMVIVTSLSNLFMVFLIFAAYAWVARDVITGNVSVGEFVMFYQAFQRGQAYLKGFLNGFASLYSHNLFLQNLYAFLDNEPVIKTPENPLSLKQPARGQIVFDKVSLTYPGTERKIINKLSLTINEGEVVALVGLNGCGKTTLVKLLCRLYDVDEGLVSFDGQDIKRINLNDLRNNVGVIFQDFIQYNLTLEENIRFGDINRPFNQDTLDSAVSMAGADELVQSLPHGYNTLLGVLFEKGQELSGGQWQKVAMARAFYKDSPLIILDEPTSALDPKAEYEVFERFKSILHKKSALLISHRMATVRMADRICVMDEGSIIEQGTHEELYDLKGQYYNLFNMQAKNYR